MNTNIWEMMYEKYKIDKTIRLIELFAGYGSQALALKYLGVDFEHWKISEWAIKSIQAYKDMHFTDKYYWENTEDCTIPKEILVDTLYDLGISSDYNKSMSKKEIQRLSYEKLVRIYENILITNNLVNVQNINWEDLEIRDTDKFTYLLTYSFPCQDLSLAGKRMGMKDNSTRSGMLWEVERILNELHDHNSLPQVLLMENVPQVHGSDNIKDFNKWQSKLEELGYKNYCQDLIATDYGIPQIRNRCFMISILGDYYYTFPKPIPLKLKLKDMLEKNVDEKYYLSDKIIKCFLKEKQGDYPRRERFLQSLKLTNEKDLAGTLTAKQGSKATDNHICEDYISLRKSLKETLKENDINDNEVQYMDCFNRKIRTDELTNTITTRVSSSNNNYLLIKNATKRGYLEAKNGDGVDISSRMKHHRGTVQSNKVQTLKTSCDIGVVDNLRIRKLTPREVFRLMGVKDEDFDKVRKNQSDSSLYHLAGDSIVVNVLMAIFKQIIE